MPKQASSASQGKDASKPRVLAEIVLLRSDPEEQASVHAIEKWIKLADFVLENGTARKKA